MTSRKQRVLALLRSRPGVPQSSSQIGNATGDGTFKVSVTLQGLKKEGLVTHTGSKRYGHWKLAGS